MQSLRDERASLRSTLQKRDARILHLEENLTQVIKPLLCDETSVAWCQDTPHLFLL